MAFPTKTVTAAMLSMAFIAAGCAGKDRGAQQAAATATAQSAATLPTASADETAIATAWAQQGDHYAASLSGAAETPAVATPGMGQAVVSFEPAKNEGALTGSDSWTVNWTVTYANSTGPLTAVHIHGPAPVGVPAGVVKPIAVGPSPLTGSVRLNAEEISSLSAGLLYVNLHTAQFPDGEIRGQLVPRPAP